MLAAEYGFSSHAHLSRSFAQAFGVPPAVYRRMTMQAA
jgi:transcriptional regulator GlxA family with amidase domain